MRTRIREALRTIPVRALTGGLVATGALLAVVGWVTRTTYLELEEVATHDLQLQRLAGSIQHLDEVLTMSARMATVTGDARFEHRYRLYEPRLAEAIARATHMSGDDSEAAAHAIDVANVRLVEMENRAFGLVRSDRPDEARELLFGPLYERYKAEYDRGRVALMDAIDAQLGASRERSRRRAFQAMALAAGSAVLLLLTWVGVVGLIGRHLSERERAARERRRLEAQIQHAQRFESLSVLAGGIAHDFNNLLTGILGNAGILRRELAMDHPAQVRIDRVIEGSKLASHLTAQLLAYAGKRRFHVQPLDLSAEVRAMQGLLESAVRDRAQLSLELDGSLPTVEADPIQLQQLLMNLVINAADAGGGAGRIRIRTYACELDEASRARLVMGSEPGAGQHVALEVQDDGRGMDEATLARIFDPFFSTKGTGRGLGLAGTLGIVHGHRGGIEVESKPDAGASFRVFLPVSGKPLVPRHEEPALELGGGGLVLVVDDDAFVLHAIDAILRSYGYDVVLAEGGREALERFRERPGEFDLVILDVTMPGMSGEETWRALREVRPDVRVLLSTGYDEEWTTRHFGFDGVAAFLRKPYEAETLAAEVKRLIGAGASTPSAPDSSWDALRSRYRAQLPDRLAELRGALHDARRAGTADGLERPRDLAHRLKGSAGSYGYDEISEAIEGIEVRLERACAGGNAHPDWDAIEAALARAERALPDESDAGRG